MVHLGMVHFLWPYNYTYDAAWEKTVPTFRAYYRLLAGQQANRKYNQIDSYLK